jgi:hypothetical protein
MSNSIARRRLLLAAVAIATAAATPSIALSSDAGSLLTGSPLKATVRQAKLTVDREIKTGGFAGLVSMVRGCYKHINNASSAADRTRCIALDLAGYYEEDASPEAYRQADLEFDDLFAAHNFQLRMAKYVPPLVDNPTTAQKQQKAANFVTIVHAFRDL